MLAGDTAAAVAAAPTTASAELTTLATASSDTVVFVDSAVSELTEVSVPIAEGAELVLLSSDADGVEQIRSHLAQRRGVCAVHIVSHGSAGQLQLGSTMLSGETLAGHVENLRGWGDTLAPNADLLIYGCDVASDESGMTLIREIARLSGADVAASNDRTANSRHAGDWDLECRVGVIESPLALSVEAMDAFEGHLAIGTLADGLIGHWRLDETSSSVPINDSSSRGNDGETQNFASPSGPTSDAANIDGNLGAFRFDGVNDYIRIGADDSLRLSDGTYSQALWIKPTSYDDRYHGVIGYQVGNSVGTRYPFIYVRNDAIYAGFGTGGNSWKGIVADDVIDIGSWNHVAVTFDGDTMQLSVNGEVVGTNSNMGGSLPTTEYGQLDIGRVNNYFVGQLDDVRMYDRALSQAEVQALAETAGSGGGAGQIDVADAEVTVNENTGTASIGLRRTGGTDGPVEVFYRTQNASALDGSDYLGTSSDSVLFADGQSTATIEVAIVNDGNVENNETFQVILTDADGAELGGQTTTIVTILDDDAEPPSGDGLIGHWRLDDGSTSGPILDSSSQGNDGQALNFTGTSGPTADGRRSTATWCFPIRWC